MNKDEFWRLVAASRARAKGRRDTFDARFKGLVAELRKLEPKQIVAFDAAFAAQSRRAFTWDLWAAAYLLSDGSCSDDWFEYFRSWLVSLGRHAFERALADPDSLAEVRFGPGLEEDCFFEQYAAAALHAYEAKTGEEMPWRSAEPAEPRRPAGRRWRSETELARRFPRLWRPRENKNQNE